MLKLIKAMIIRHVFREYHRNYLIYIYNLQQLANNPSAQMYQLLNKCQIAYDFDLDALKRFGAENDDYISGMLSSDSVKLMDIKDNVEDRIYEKNNESYLEQEYGIKQ